MARGEIYASPMVAEAVFASGPPVKGRGRLTEGLTPRQREVLRPVAEGYTMKETARQLNLSPKTVEFHKYQIMDVSGLRTTAELTAWAIRQGILPG